MSAAAAAEEVHHDESAGCVKQLGIACAWMEVLTRLSAARLQ